MMSVIVVFNVLLLLLIFGVGMMAANYYKSDTKYSEYCNDSECYQTTVTEREDFIKLAQLSKEEFLHMFCQLLTPPKEREKLVLSSDNTPNDKRACIIDDGPHPLPNITDEDKFCVTCMFDKMFEEPMKNTHGDLRYILNCEQEGKYQSHSIGVCSDLSKHDECNCNQENRLVPLLVNDVDPAEAGEDDFNPYYDWFEVGSHCKCV